MDLNEREKIKHRLNPTDPMLASLLESLRRFFCNTPEQNMALTEVLATLAVCPDRSLAGWLTFAVQGDKLPSDLEPYASLARRKDDGDDRSIDWRIQEELSMKSQPLTTSGIDDRARPVVYTILHGLVSQLERYRQLVDDFDRFLLERRQGLLFSENLTDALTLALELDSHAFPARVLSPTLTTMTPSSPETARPKAKSKSASFVSFLTPRKRSAKQSVSDVPAQRGQRGPGASPFGPHYLKTGAIVVEPYLAPAPSDGPWTPAKPRKWNVEEADAFASGQWGEMGAATKREEVFEEETQPKVIHVTLSQLLDNVVILEECMKELVAIIHARRSLGIDSIRYL